MADVSIPTHSFGVGPISLDVQMAREHGWSDKQLLRAMDKIEDLSKKESRIAVRRHPERYARMNGVLVFQGVPRA